MQLRSLVQTSAVAAVLMSAATSARSDDKVRTKEGAEVTGTIDKISANGIVMASGKTIPAPNIDYVRFNRELPQMSGARGLMKKGDYAQARIQLNAIAEPTRLAMIEEIAFRKALCLVHMAMPLDADAKMTAAREMLNFTKNHSNSFHFYEANKSLGDVLVAAGKSSAAITYYKILANSRWPAYQMQGKLAMADLLYLGNKFADAKTVYQSIMDIKAADSVAQAFRMQGRLGYAACLAAMSEPKKALEITQEVIKNADPAAEQLHARAYNTLGKCYLKSGSEGAAKQALRAFLIVDIVYGAYADEHAESLYYLQGIWTKAGDRGNGNEARTRLLQQYPASTWAKRAGSS